MLNLKLFLKTGDFKVSMSVEREGYTPTAEDRLMAQLEGYRKNPDQFWDGILYGDIQNHRFPINALIRGQTVLGYAAQHRLVSLMDAVLRNPFCNPDILDTEGHNALSIAFRFGHFDMAQKLLDGGANINTRLKSKNGGTALHILAELDDEKLSMRGHFAKGPQNILNEHEAFFVDFLNTPYIDTMARDYDGRAPIDLCKSRAISNWLMRDGRVNSYVRRTYGTDTAPLSHERAIYLNLSGIDKKERLKRIETAIKRAEHNLVIRLLEPMDYDEEELRSFLSQAIHVKPIERAENILTALVDAGADINHTEGALLEHILRSDQCELSHVKLVNRLGIDTSKLSERRRFEALKRKDRLDWAKDVGISSLMLSDALTKLIGKVLKDAPDGKSTHIKNAVQLVKAGATAPMSSIDALLKGEHIAFLDAILPHYSKAATKLTDRQKNEIFKAHLRTSVNSWSMLYTIARHPQKFSLPAEAHFSDIREDFSKAYLDSLSEQERGEVFVQEINNCNDLFFIKDILARHKLHGDVEQKGLSRGIVSEFKTYERAKYADDFILNTIFSHPTSETPNKAPYTIDSSVFNKVLEELSLINATKSLKYLLNPSKCVEAEPEKLLPRALYELSTKAQKRGSTKTAEFLNNHAHEVRLVKAGRILSPHDAKNLARFERDLFKRAGFKERASVELQKITGLSADHNIYIHGLPRFDTAAKAKVKLLFEEYLDTTLKQLPSEYILRCLERLPEDIYWPTLKSIIESGHDGMMRALLDSARSEKIAMKIINTVLQRADWVKNGTLTKPEGPSENALRQIQTWAIKHKKMDVVERTIDLDVMTEGLFRYNASIMALSPDTKQFSAKLYRAQTLMRAMGKNKETMRKKKSTYSGGSFGTF